MNVAHADMADVVPNVDASTLRWRLGVLVAIVGAGDFLLFRHSLGLSVALFAGVVEIATVLAAGVNRRKAIVCALVGLATLAPVIEDVNTLSLAIALCGAGTLALIANGGITGSFAEWVLQVLEFLAAGPFHMLLDIPEVGSKVLIRRFSGRALIAWALPIGLGGVFLALFSAANPVVEAWLAAIDIRPLLALLDIWRLSFWLALLALVWPFVMFRSLKQGDGGSSKPKTVCAKSSAPGDFLTMFFGEAAILRSLTIFNGMFAVQTMLDVAILWRRHSLPADVSFASYAHRGAYPLVATALLAGAFVVLAMRPGSAASRSPLIRTLVYVWIGQNVALVISSLYRLELYVQVYSLTYWRLAAFIWTGLVAIGLVLVIAQLSTQRSNRWLLSANVVAAMAALYLCGFANFDYLIADYNLRHCREVSSGSAALDMDYLESLGPDAIPAVDAALSKPGSPLASGRLMSVRSTIDMAQQSRPDDWRSWTFRKWRLSRYLEAETGTSTKP